MDGDRHVASAELEERLSALEAARSWSPRVVSKLEARIREGEDLGLFRVNPLAYAAEAAMDEDEAVDLFLHAARVGLFRMEWNLVCASCGNTAQSFRGLAKVDPHFICDLCQMVNEPTLDGYVQVAFTVSPSVRSIVYHDPDSLSAEDRIFTYQRSRDILADTGEPSTLATLRSTTHLVDYVEPGATAQVAFEFSGEVFAVRDMLHAASATYLRAEGATDDAATSVVRLALADGRLQDLDRQLEPVEFTLPEGPEMRLLFPGVARLANGPVQLSMRNDMAERASIWVPEYPVIPETFEPIQFEPVLTAKQVLSTQTFRTLFRSETIAASESLEIRDLTFLFTDLRDSTAMYERIGDASAYNLVRLHFDALEVVIREHRGAIVKTIGDAIMATFVEPAGGVRAATQMAASLDDFNRTSSTDLVLKVGLHRGHAIAVTSNDSVDYFGQTVNIAARIQAMAGPGELCLSEDVRSAPGVVEALADHAIEQEDGIMKGVSETIPVYRITLG